MQTTLVSTAVVPQAPWSNDRYTPLGFVGSGSFGDVYRVHDRIRGHEVALKLLHQRDAETSRLLRKEFRALKDIDHVNLVELYELHLEEQVGYFTMEYVEGVPIDEWVDLGPPLERGARIRLALRQLVDAVEAMHAHGVLHRDLKPTNIVVAPSGRLVVLDAGLAKNLESQEHSNRYICGTAWYMSPEQARGAILTPASDWYSVGVIAHKLFTDAVPFEGDPMVVLQHKSLQAPTSVASRLPELAASDVRMIDGLLAIAPDDRPSVGALRAWLDVATDGVARTPFPRRFHSERFVGRHAELAAMNVALEEVATQGRVEALQVVGHAGIGKSTLVREWLAAQTPERQLHVIQGQCFQRELTPYNGLDELFAILVEVIAAGIESGHAAAHAAIVGFLAERVDGAGPALGHPELLREARPEPVERRRLLGVAVHQLLVGRARQRPTVLWLDDAQWVSRETAALISELLEREWPHGLLVVLSSRNRAEGDEAQEHVPAARLQRRGRRIELTALDPASAEALFLLHGGSRERASHVLEEAQGHPLLLSQAALFGTRHDGPLSLRAILSQRIEALDPDARAVLEVLCVADAPTSEALALAVVGPTATPQAARKLVASGLAIRVGVSGHRLIPFHASVRTTVTELMTQAAIETLHYRLAHTLEQTQEVEPDALVVHYLAAGAKVQALVHMRRSAQHLVEVFAFDRAVSMYKRLLALSEEPTEATPPLEPGERLALRKELAQALENAGRCEEAGRLWLVLADECEAHERDQLRHRAADNLIRSGHVDEGLAVQKVALDRLGVRVSRSALRAIPFIILDRVRLRLRGLGYRLQPSSSADPRRLARIDGSIALGAVLPLIDTIRGLQVHGQALRDALAIGEPARLARALAMEAGYVSALSGGRDRKGRSDGLLATARLVAEASGDPRAKGTVAIMYGSSRWSVGDWDGCIEHSRQGLERLRGDCMGVSWEANFALTHLVNAMQWKGQLNEHRREVMAGLADARARGDLYAEVMFTLRDLATLHVQADAPEAARATAQVLDRWTNRGFQIEHMVELYQQTEVMLYQQRGAEVWQWVTSRWKPLTRSQLLRLQVFRIELSALRARAALCAMLELPNGRRRATFLSEARSLARLVAKERPAVRALALGAPITAAVALQEGREDVARATLAEALGEVQRLGMRLYAAAMGAALGHLEGGDGGRERVAEASSWMRTQGIVSPERYLTMMMPGVVARP